MRFNRDGFEKLHRDSLSYLPAILQRLLPDGRVEGHEYVALNPRRADTKHGSFKVNLRTARWADFAVNIHGGDVVSLAAYLLVLSQREAAEVIARIIGRGGNYE